MRAAAYNFKCRSDTIEPDYLQSGQLANLRKLSLSYNKFIGVIPTSLDQLMILKSLYFSSNYFAGAILSSLEQLVNLNYLDLSNNHFDGFTPQIL
ncbi:hypothetical protein L6164_003140 [Bauhinia variegata]|uniref:Uncharacterized protein n=1 Tax=Bauhinia variegata TaxID=167791 RepID=A0ACB9Q5W7_BAUVA|nr:hypothetical protein L6164_003140 [Bauhinia variegata]